MLVRSLALVVALALAAACGTPVGASPSPTSGASAATPPPGTGAPTPTPAPTAYLSPRGTITVDQPRAFARVASPVTVSGSAQLFEAAFVWRLLDLSGRELAKGAGMTNAGAPARGTYSFSVSFTVTADTYAYVSVLSHSARDGSVDDEARVPMILAPR